jgi:ABC-type spermidine/putrescine transport system permease subunit I
MVKSERFRLAGVPYAHWMAVVAVIALGVVPLTLSLLRLWAVTGITPWEALAKVHQHPGAMEALQFSFFEAMASMVFTVIIGLPLAWAFRTISVEALENETGSVVPPVCDTTCRGCCGVPCFVFTRWNRSSNWVRLPRSNRIL